jgi:hypothetical protein
MLPASRVERFVFLLGGAGGGIVRDTVR